MGFWEKLKNKTPLKFYKSRIILLVGFDNLLFSPKGETERKLGKPTIGKSENNLNQLEEVYIVILIFNSIPPV